MIKLITGKHFRPQIYIGQFINPPGHSVFESRRGKLSGADTHHRCPEKEDYMKSEEFKRV